MFGSPTSGTLPLPLGSLRNPPMLRVTSLGSGTRCFIFDLPPLPLGELHETWGGESSWATALSFSPLQTEFPCLSLLRVSLSYLPTLHSLPGLIPQNPCSNLLFLGLASPFSLTNFQLSLPPLLPLPLLSPGPLPLFSFSSSLSSPCSLLPLFHDGLWGC